MTVGRTAPIAPVRVGVATLLSLLAGRGAFRLAFQAANLSLLAVWGSAVFGPYAAALGTMAWLVFVGSAVEKAVLKTMPRARLTGADLAHTGLALAALPLVVTLAALLPATVLAPGSRTVLYLLAATWNAATGLLFLLAALHRLDGRPVGDSRTFFVLGLCIAASLAVSWSFGFGPNRQLAMMDAAALALLVTTTRGLPGPWRAVRRLPRRRAVVRILARTTWLLGVYDLAAAVSASMLYLVLTLTGRGKQADLLFLALLGSGVAGGMLLYLLRVAAPGASARLRGAAGAAAGRRQASRLLGWAVWGGVGFAVAGGLAAASGVLVDRAGAGLVGVTAVEVTLYTVVTCAAFLLENTDDRAPRITSTAAGCGMLATVVLALVLVPGWGAVGAMAAPALSAGVQAGVMLVALRRQYGPPRRWVTTPGG